MRRVSNFALPPDLRDGIKKFLSGVSGTELATRARNISQNYKMGRPSRRAIASKTDVAAYLATRSPASFAAVAAAFAALNKRAPTFAPSSVLDAGSGPGTASWAAVERWPGIESVTLVDENEEMTCVARSLCAEARHSALRAAKVRREGIGADISAEIYDLVVAGYAIAECDRSAMRAALQTLWRATAHALVIVEPGSPEGFARIRDARDWLAKDGAEIAAPCPHRRPCPMRSPDWCHFGQILPRSRDHMRAKGAKLPFEVEKFSYLVLTRNVPLVPPKARIIGRPAREKFGLKFWLCGQKDLSERLILKRDRLAYREAAHKKWGDTLPI